MAIAALVAATGAAPRPLPNPHGWSKPGVSYLQYRTDTTECGYIASQVKMPDVSSSAPSMPTIMPGDREALDTLELYSENYQQYTMIMTKKVVDNIQTALDACLAARGYRPFRVTPEQMSELRRLQKGTAARYRFIYRLGTDPKVLADQGL